MRININYGDIILMLKYECYYAFNFASTTLLGKEKFSLQTHGKTAFE